MRYRVEEEGIVHIKVNGNTEIDVPDVIELVNELGKLFQNKKFPLLIVTEDYTLPTRDARHYIALAESDPYAAAEAYVVRSYAQKLVGNFFLNFNKPARPTRIFMDEIEARKWLHDFL